MGDYGRWCAPKSPERAHHPNGAIHGGACFGIHGGACFAMHHTKRAAIDNESQRVFGIAGGANHSSISYPPRPASDAEDTLGLIVDCVARFVWCMTKEASDAGLNM